MWDPITRFKSENSSTISTSKGVTLSKMEDLNREPAVSSFLVAEAMLCAPLCGSTRISIFTGGPDSNLEHSSATLARTKVSHDINFHGKGYALVIRGMFQWVDFEVLSSLGSLLVVNAASEREIKVLSQDNLPYL